jgi:hypothetical protein
VSAIVMHAGMPKAGSSSIQRWLRTNVAGLRERGFTLVVAPPNEAGEIVLRPHEQGPVNSGWVIDRAIGRPAAEQRVTIDTFSAGLAAAADAYGNIVVSGESFAHPFWSLHEPSLVGFERLSTLHDLRIAYYVRPQHTTLEAAWRQWGFRSGESPSTYLESYASHLHHARTVKGVEALAPGVAFGLRPLREDLLDHGNLVCDFAGRFLGIDVEPVGEWANRGLPLELANLLRAAPHGMFWDSGSDNDRIERIKRLLAEDELPEDDRLPLSRLVLHQYAFERFAAENAALGWHDFVPTPAHASDLPGLEALDSLWTPLASPAELAFVFRALSTAI